MHPKLKTEKEEEKKKKFKTRTTIGNIHAAVMATHTHVFTSDKTQSLFNRVKDLSTDRHD